MEIGRSEAQAAAAACRVLRSAKGVVALAVLLLHVGCASRDLPATGAAQAQPGQERSDDLLVVDCLLPAQVRKLGQNMVFLAPRQAIKTSGRNCEIRGGEYVAYDRANYATALKVWLPPAEGGDSAAQTYVGEIFERGLGVPPDYDAAATWYRRAAENGYSRAAINLGNLFEQGLGVPKDPKQALNWYRRAAGLSQLTFDIVPGPTDAELRESRHQVAELRAQLQSKEAALDTTQSQLEPLQRKVSELQRDADELRKKIDSSPPPIHPAPDQPKPVESASPERLKDEAALAAKQMEIAVLREQIRGMEAQPGLKREVANLRQALAQAETELLPLKAGFQPRTRETSQGGPRIELKQVQVVEPAILVSTRDGQAGQISVPAGARSWVVVGRVDSSTPLKSLAINQRPRTPDRDNVFTVRLTEADRQLRIVATDRSERTSTLEFLLPVVQQDRRTYESPTVRLTGSQLTGVRRSLGNYHALVIGNNSYRQIRPLKTAVHDAQEVAKVLRDQYGFNVTLLTNSTRYAMLNALNELRDKLTKDDNLLIYYAGHGQLDARNGRGYWLPVDADPNSSASWIANEALTSILDAMAVKQLLLVADSCYSGTLTRSAMGYPQLQPGISQDEVLRLIQQMAQKRSRMAMTSGGIAPILDSGGGTHSIFAEVFLKVLRGNDGLLIGRDLFRQVQLQVVETAARLPLAQAPEYAPIKGGYEGGDFVLVPSTS
jgi:hypothetical protein